LDAESQARFLSSLAVVLGLWLLRALVLYAVHRRTEDVRIRYRWRKSSTHAAVLLAVCLIGWMWLDRIQSMATFFGLVSAGLTIALREPLTNLAGWIFILWRRPFRMGDRIQIGTHAGDVIDLRIFQFSLLEIGNWVAADQSTGRIIYIPNGSIFSQELINYTQGLEYIWDEIPVRVTFESDWEKAKVLLQDIADRHGVRLSPDEQERVRRSAGRFMIVYSVLTPTVYTRVEDHGVSLTLRYLCEPRRRRSRQAAIWEDVLRVFAEHPDVEFAYPTQRFYNRWAESPRQAGHHRTPLGGDRPPSVTSHRD
jgi:small-conductance mechanosensitive channel